MRPAAKVVHDLRSAVETCGLVEVPHGIEQEQLDAGHLRESGIGLELVQPRRRVDARERFGRLVDELDTLAIDRDRAQLFRGDDLKGLRRLVGRSVEGRRAQQRDPVVDAEVSHQRIDPPRRVWPARRAILRTQDDEEPLPGTCELALLHEASGRGIERGGRHAERLHGVGFGQVAAATPEPLVEKLSERVRHSPIIRRIWPYTAYMAYDWGRPIVELLSLRLSLWRAKTAPPGPTAAKSPERRCA